MTLTADLFLQAFGLVAGLLIFLIVLIGKIFFCLGERDPEKWYGKMACFSCGYLWPSRRNTPPARCPRCRSNQIGPQLG